MAEKKRRFRRSGDTFLWYLLLYALERALVEGLRTDSLYLMGLRVSQMLSLAAAVVVCAVFVARAAAFAVAGALRAGGGRAAAGHCHRAQA